MTDTAYIAAEAVYGTSPHAYCIPCLWAGLPCTNDCCSCCCSQTTTLKPGRSGLPWITCTTSQAGQACTWVGSYCVPRSLAWVPSFSCMPARYVACCTSNEPLDEPLQPRSQLSVWCVEGVTGYNRMRDLVGRTSVQTMERSRSFWIPEYKNTPQTHISTTPRAYAGPNAASSARILSTSCCKWPWERATDCSCPCARKAAVEHPNTPAGAREVHTDKLSTPLVKDAWFRCSASTFSPNSRTCNA